MIENIPLAKMKLTVSVVVMLLIVAAVDAAELEVNCAKHPAEFRALRDCCDVPIPHFDMYGEKCKSTVGLNVFKSNACQYECIFDLHHVLDGYTLNYPHVYTMLNTSLQQEDFVKVYYRGFQECEALLKLEFKELKSTVETIKSRGNKCSTLPMIYTLCAHLKLFLYCPEAAWYSTPKCDITRAYVGKCDRELAREGLKILKTLGKKSKQRQRKGNQTTSRKN